MPVVRNEIMHNLGQAEAIKRLKATCENAHSFSDLQETWFGSRVEFKASVQGIRISGNVEVTEDELRFEARVPLIALPFKSWIPNILKNALKTRKPVAELRHAESDKPLLLYLHIPKAGGTTLGDFIYNQCENGENDGDGLIRNGVFFSADGFFRDNESGFSPLFKNLLGRNHLRAVIGHFGYGIHQLADRPFHYVTMLRNPVSRVISLYQYLKLEDKMSLEQFANECPYREIDNDQTRRIAGVNPEAGKCNRKDLETAKENLRDHFAVVGITERFDESLALIKLRFNWSKNIPSYPKNVNRDKKPIISDAAKLAVEKRNQFDIELYQYGNQLMNEMIAALGPLFESVLKQQKDLNTLKTL